MISVKVYGSKINLHPLIIESLNTGKTVFKKDYWFDKVFNIFDEIDNYRYSRTSNKITTKNKMLEYLKIGKYKPTDMPSTLVLSEK